MNPLHRIAFSFVLLGMVTFLSCSSSVKSEPQSSVRPSSVGITASPLPRLGDEIMVCGKLFHTGAPVVLWTDPGGYDAYRTDRRFAPYDQADWEATKDKVKAIRSPNRYDLRYTSPANAHSVAGDNFVLTEDELQRARAGWDFDDLRNRIDQFVYHYDVAGTSRNCFMILHDLRGLSVHFMLDLDGTIYQTLDLKERAWHATTSNTRSVGIEIANMGAYTTRANNPLAEWYVKDASGHTVIHLPARYGDGGLRDKSQILRPARDEIISGLVQGNTYHQYDLTPRQYNSLIKLTATLCTLFPNMKCDYPRDKDGKLIPVKLSDDVLTNYQGLLGHYHVQKDKQNPGPAFQWDAVVNGARALMRGESAASHR
jgi:N-acetylmuramoyl-L-alanine amidase